MRWFLGEVVSDERGVAAMDEYGERQCLGFGLAQRKGGMPSGEMLYRGQALNPQP